MNDFDIAALEAADTALLRVLDQRGNPLLGAGGQPVTIELYGPGSEQYAQAQAKIDSAGTARAFAAATGKMPVDVAAENRQLNAEKFAACTKAINNLPNVTARDLYANRRLGYITSQVAKFIEDWANFPAASAQT